ncbi:Uncharacterised protein [Klebsiella pneumoniae]|nr:Uncharacterised protein [Klebsiella pneumoniae]
MRVERHIGAKGHVPPGTVLRAILSAGISRESLVIAHLGPRMYAP